MLTRKERLEKLWKRVRLLRRPSGRASPVFICGMQRSGTNMLIRAFNRHSETECYYENDPEAFDNYVLRDEQTVQRLIRRSRAAVVFFKPIADSQHARRMLQTFDGLRVIWLYRWYEDAVNSALRNWKHHFRELQIMIEEPEAAGWRIEELDDEMWALLRHWYAKRISDASVRALLWCVRNQHFFRQRLQEEPRVHLVNYERLVQSPAKEMEWLCGLIGLRYEPSLAEGIHRRSVRKSPPPDIHPEIRALCDAMYRRLETVFEQRRGSCPPPA